MISELNHEKHPSQPLLQQAQYIGLQREGFHSDLNYDCVRIKKKTLRSTVLLKAEIGI